MKLLYIYCLGAPFPCHSEGEGGEECGCEYHAEEGHFLFDAVEILTESVQFLPLPEPELFLPSGVFGFQFIEFPLNFRRVLVVLGGELAELLADVRAVPIGFGIEFLDAQFRLAGELFNALEGTGLAPAGTNAKEAVVGAEVFCGVGQQGGVVGNQLFLFLSLEILCLVDAERVVQKIRIADQERLGRGGLNQEGDMVRLVVGLKVCEDFPCIALRLIDCQKS